MFTQKNSSDDAWLSITLFIVIALIFFLLIDVSQETKAEEDSFFIKSIVSEKEPILFYENNTIFASSSPTHQKAQTVAIIDESNIEKKWVEITGYSSTVDQTNSDPFTTASGEHVRDGIVAANFLPFGTKIRILEMFGDKIFVVKDRMNRRYSPPYDNVWHDGYVDIWFHTREEARQQGREITYIEILN
mgnify:CR=1 FL=1